MKIKLQSAYKKISLMIFSYRNKNDKKYVPAHILSDVNTKPLLHVSHLPPPLARQLSQFGAQAGIIQQKQI